MGTEMVVATNRVQKFFDDLQSQKALLSASTDLYAALQNSLAAKIQSLDSRSRQTLASLDLRDSSLPDRHASAAARVSDQKLADIAGTLKSLRRKMDTEGLLRFIVWKRKESMALRAEAVEGFVESKAKKIGVTVKRWACGLLVQALFPEARANLGLAFARSVAGIAERWDG